MAAAALSAVAGDLAADRGRTPAQATGDLPNRVASGQQDTDPASFGAGQLAAAPAYDSSPLFVTWQIVIRLLAVCNTPPNPRVLHFGVELGFEKKIDRLENRFDRLEKLIRENCS
ncbi:MAG: hypothetical protein OXF20_05625 [Gammaproteobacteria bacterium]|nr:hypothetical protein [Gammaproteobacteria bacterium]